MNADDNNRCALVEVHYGEVCHLLCAPNIAPLSQGADPGDDIISWAEWIANNKDVCGLSVGSFAFQIPAAQDLVWKDSCVEQIATSDFSCGLVKRGVCFVDRTNRFKSLAPVQNAYQVFRGPWCQPILWGWPRALQGQPISNSIDWKY